MLFFCVCFFVCLFVFVAILTGKKKERKPKHEMITQETLGASKKEKKSPMFDSWLSLLIVELLVSAVLVFFVHSKSIYAKSISLVLVMQLLNLAACATTIVLHQHLQCTDRFFVHSVPKHWERPVCIECSKTSFQNYISTRVIFLINTRMCSLMLLCSFWLKISWKF